MKNTHQKLKGIEAAIPHDRAEYVSEDGSGGHPLGGCAGGVRCRHCGGRRHNQQVVALDDTQLEQLRTVLADMHQISHSNTHGGT